MAEKRKMDPLDISKHLGKAKERVDRIGIELEGGWEKLPPDTRLTRDGSVHVEATPVGLTADEAQRFADLHTIAGIRIFTAQEGKDYGQLQLKQRIPRIEVGELPSPIMEPKKAEQWMKTFYPSHVNGTCGLHVHMSFKHAITYQQLMDARYQDTIVEELTKWAKKENLDLKHPIWERLAGKCRFCKLDFTADEQVRQRQKGFDQGTPGNRYTAINYSYGIHGTIECRLLPMMSTWDQGYRAIKHVLDITNAFLVAPPMQSRKEERLPVYLKMDDDNFVDNIREYI